MRRVPEILRNTVGETVSVITGQTVKVAVADGMTTGLRRWGVSLPMLGVCMKYMET